MTNPTTPKHDKLVLSSNVFSALKSRIIRWQYPPGHRLTEEELCEEFGVSRSPIREALRRLVENGLVDKAPHRGYHVKQPDTTEIQELYDVRLAIESFVVERVAETGTWRPELGDLRATWQGLLDGLPSNIDNVAQADERFHETLASLTGNQSLHELLRGINERLGFVRQTDITTSERLRLTCEQHLSILSKIEAGDAAGAREAMRQNIEQGRLHVETAIKEALARAFREQRNKPHWSGAPTTGR